MSKPPAEKMVRPLSRYVFICLGALLVIMGIGVYVVHRSTSVVEVRHVSVADERLNKVFNGKVVVQISDVHAKSIGKREEKVLSILDQQKPDILFLTGDYVTWNGDYAAALGFLARLRASKGLYGVMGDYDYSNSRKSCLYCHEKESGRPTDRHHVNFLRDVCETVRWGDRVLKICGVDNKTVYELNSHRSIVKQLINDRTPTIVLSHSPLVFDLFSEDDDVLILSGDTHGGQVPLPSWVWRLFGYEKNAKYEHGWFEKGKKKMYVNRGIGMSHFPIRFLRRPEITIFHFQTASTTKH